MDSKKNGKKLTLPLLCALCDLLSLCVKKKLARIGKYFSLCSILVGCCNTPLHLRIEFVGVDQYASYYVETPDPNFECPALGQHLIIDWVVPDHFADMPDLNVFVKVRFYNGSEQILTIPLHTLKGTYYWVIVRDEYDTTGGIATFQAFLRSGSFDLYEWKHQLWNETIQLNIE